ncbi:hypothetical protein FHT76_004316 [Rhizobium sp. BK176]|nr:hypothetical protein [Rhizobium sp. BK176]
MQLGFAEGFALRPVDAFGLPLIFITAWEGLVDRVGIRAGQKLLVLGGGGGIGHVAVQIGKSIGADVYAVDGARKADYIKSLNATPIDYATETVEEYVAKYRIRSAAARSSHHGCRRLTQVSAIAVASILGSQGHTIIQEVYHAYEIRQRPGVQLPHEPSPMELDGDLAESRSPRQAIPDPFYDPNRRHAPARKSDVLSIRKSQPQFIRLATIFEDGYENWLGTPLACN